MAFHIGLDALGPGILQPSIQPASLKISNSGEPKSQISIPTHFNQMVAFKELRELSNILLPMDIGKSYNFLE